MFLLCCGTSINEVFQTEHVVTVMTVVLGKRFLRFVTVKVKFTLQKATKAQRGSRGIALLFL